MSELVVSRPQIAQIEFSKEQIEAIKATIMPGSTNAELSVFTYVCKRTGLDPFSRQIYAMKRWDDSQRKEVYMPVTSIDGLRVIAERTGKYTGQVGPWWCDESGEWTDVWLSESAPFAAKVGVLRADFKEPLYAVARFSSYARVSKKTGELLKTWAQMPELMLAKVAEALALRKAFPHDMSGIYTNDELENTVETKPQEVKAVQVQQPKQENGLTWDGESICKLDVPRSVLGNWIMTFGKYKGKSLKEIPGEYLNWLVFEKAYKEKADNKIGFDLAHVVSHVQEYLVEQGEVSPDQRVLAYKEY